MPTPPAPIITTGSPTFVNTSSFVSVSSASSLVSYDQIKASLGSYVFGIRKVYFQAEPLQLTKPLLFVKRQANGDKLVEPLTQVYDPYQAQNSLFEDVSKREFILDGFTNIVTDVLPNQSISLFFETIQLSYSEVESGKTPFYDLVKKADLTDFFQDYVSKVEVRK